MTLHPLPLLVVFIAVVVAAIRDVRTFKIHNPLTYSLLVTGLLYHAGTDGPGGLAASGLGALTGFGLTVPGYLVGGMGAGDVKLMAGVGAWLGPPATLAVFLAAAVATGVYGVVLVARSGRFRETWANLGRLFRRSAPGDQVEKAIRRHDRGRLVPFGVMTAVGILAVYVMAWWRLGC